MNPDSEIASRLDIREQEGGVLFSVLVQPRSKKDQIVGIQDGYLKIKVTAPPVEGAANAACLKILSRVFGKSKTALVILKGQTSHHKLVFCPDFSADQLREALKNAGLLGDNR